MRHAVINGQGIVKNVVELLDSTQWQPPVGHTLVRTDTGNIDDTWNGAIFVPPVPPPLPPQMTPDQIIDVAVNQKGLIRALILCLNDGTLPIASNLSSTQIRTILKAKF